MSLALVDFCDGARRHRDFRRREPARAPARTYAADIDREIRGSAKLPTLPERLRPEAPVDLLRRRPDIRAAERELAAATERIGVKTADLFPSVAPDSRIWRARNKWAKR
jgi:hypothetical protein